MTSLPIFDNSWNRITPDNTSLHIVVGLYSAVESQWHKDDMTKGSAPLTKLSTKNGCSKNLQGDPTRMDDCEQEKPVGTPARWRSHFGAQDQS